ALNCIDHLGVILVTLASRKLHERNYLDANGQARIVAHERSFYDLVRLAFDQIRHYGAADPIIIIRMLDTIVQVAAAAWSQEYREVLAQHVERIAAATEARIVDAYELKAVRAHIEHAREVLSGIRSQESGIRNQESGVGR